MTRWAALLLLLSLTAAAAEPDAGVPPLLPDGGVAGKLRKEHIHDVISRARPAIRRCYEEHLARSFIDGKLVIRFVIGPDGSVAAAEISQDTLDAPAVADCLLAVARAWRFERPAGGGSVTVNYPFIFKAAWDDGGS